jgi:hypothetical protein
MLKTTFPVGTPVPVLGAADAVNVTFDPVTAGLAFEVTVVPVGLVETTVPKVNSETNPVVKFCELKVLSNALGVIGKFEAPVYPVR